MHRVTDIARKHVLSGCLTLTETI